MNEVERWVQWAAGALGYRFSRPELLLEALTHPSYAYEAGGGTPSNQRLEFLGDAVVGLAISDLLFRQFPGRPEGELSKLKAGVVSAPTLARVAGELGVGEMLRLGRGEEGSGGRGRASNLADAFEALMGAIYLDGGLAAANQFLLRTLAPQVEAARAGQLHPNYKARLLEWAQKELGEPPAYHVLTAEGPDHARRFRVAVTLGGRTVGEGVGNSKREAEQEAARTAMRFLHPHN